MVFSINNEIFEKLHGLYPSCTLYDEDIPQNFKTPSFLLTVIDQDYSNRLGKASKGAISYDLAYYSNKQDIKTDCAVVAQNIFRSFDVVGGYRILDKQSTIVDNVLHVTFKVKYSEIKVEEVEIMQHKIIIERGK